MNKIKYFECHITIEPVFGERLDRLAEIVKPFGFRPAKLLMQKDRQATPERSQKDTFCTAHSKVQIDIETRMRDCVSALLSTGYQVWRQKIEAVILDERF